MYPLFWISFEIIVPANTYIASILAISDNNLIPVLVEPNPTTFNIDFNLIEEKITSKTKGFLLVHLYGQVAFSDKIIELKEKYNLKIITGDILNSDNLIKITLGNPKEINSHVWDGFTKFSIGNTFTYDEYSESQYADNLKYITLYIGEVPLNSDNYYKQFFTVNNIELSEENILQFRPLVLIFAGWLKSEGSSYTPSKSDFQSYIATNVLSKAEDRLVT